MFTAEAAALSCLFWVLGLNKIKTVAEIAVMFVSEITCPKSRWKPNKLHLGKEMVFNCIGKKRIIYVHHRQCKLQGFARIVVNITATDLALAQLELRDG